jgi:hypothetical protein
MTLPSVAKAEAAAHPWLADKLCGPGARVGINPIFYFRKTATEYDRKSGVKWFSCTAKCDGNRILP